MQRRSYDQYCAVAKALDVIGERWTLLILRDLVHLGPRRFSDLKEGLPGIGANLLTERLRHLEREDIVRRRRLEPPARGVVYELTELGAGLEPMIIELGRWGGNFMGERRAGDVFFATGHVSAIRATFRSDDARGIRARYEFQLDGEVFHVHLDDGRVEARPGPSGDPDLVIETDVNTSIELMLRQLPPGNAVRSGAARLTGGDLRAFEQAIDLLAWVPRYAGA